MTDLEPGCLVAIGKRPFVVVRLDAATGKAVLHTGSKVPAQGVTVVGGPEAGRLFLALEAAKANRQIFRATRALIRDLQRVDQICGTTLASDLQEVFKNNPILGDPDAV